MLQALAALALLADPSVESQLCARSLRPGELERLEQAQGPLDGSDLTRAELELDVGKRRVAGAWHLLATVPLAGEPRLTVRAAANVVAPGAVRLLKLKLDGRPARVSERDGGLWVVALPPGVRPGDRVELEARLEATIPRAAVDTDALGAAMGVEDFGLLAATGEVVNLAGLFPLVERKERAAPPSGLGDLTAASPQRFLVTVTASKGYRVLASGAQLADAPLPDGRGRFSFAVAGARDFGLLALKGAQVETRRVGEVTVEAWAGPGETEGARRMADTAAQSLEALEARLGPSPYATLRVVSFRLTGGAGGAEFPGLVTVSQQQVKGGADPLEALGLPGFQQLPGAKALLPAVEALRRDALELTVEHEVAHQYFAVLVGSDPVEHPATDEALAQHVALLLHEWRRGAAAAQATRQRELVLGYQVFRFWGGEDEAADRPTTDFRSATEYSALVYGKAPLLYDAERALLGDAAWQEALRRYVAASRWRLAEPRGLTRVAQTLAPAQAQALEQLHTRWWDEAHGDEDLGPMALQAPSLAGTDAQTRKLFEQALKALQGE
ncbi:MAG: aminopeptidase [Myxococcaceae bacterium]|nr:aminopeptidase [Myxococcaceae bacterium]